MPHPPLPRRQSRPRLAPALAAGLAGAVLLAVTIAGCETAPREPSSGPAPVTYTGPEYLRGTVRSLCRIRHYQPKLVSGYGLVVNLNGTGSTGVPAFLRQHMINYAKQMGLGSARLDTEQMSPERVLADPNTAVVAVYGLIPPGAVNGTRFDVLVQALPQTQTTSLAGGRLWTTELAVQGTNRAMQYSTPVAKARGSIYLDPFKAEQQRNSATQPADVTAAETEALPMRDALVVSGGQATQRRRIELILNQPSWTRSRAIADRINERFPARPGERVQTASAQTDTVIRLSIPRRFANDPGELIDLIAHLYIQRGPGFEQQQARRLVEALKRNPDNPRSVVLAWRALGKTVRPVLREQYTSDNLQLRLACLEAGAALEDERASKHLADLGRHEDPAVRSRVANALSHLPNSLRGGEALRRLLDDENRDVRITAYESLALINNQAQTVIRRFGVEGPEDYKYVIDQVPSERPMIYITHEHMPRIVIFKPDLGFDEPMLARLWDNRLMLRTETLAEARANANANDDDADGDAPTTQPVTTQASDPTEAGAGPDHLLSVYYQPPRRIEGKTYKLMPTVATLAYMLGHKPTMADPQDGLDLTYSRVADVLHQLCKGGHIDAPIEVNTRSLARVIERYQNRRDDSNRRPTSDSAGDSTSDADAGRATESAPAGAETGGRIGYAPPNEADTGGESTGRAREATPDNP